MPPLRAAVARCFLGGLPGPTLDRETRRLHVDVPFAGVTLFRQNAGDPASLRALVRDLHGLDPASPPLVAIDHEGGRVHRLSPPFTHFPVAATIAARGLPAVRAVAAAMARELAALEIDLTFAPVLDVASNPANPIIGDRAFGATPEAATPAALAAFRAMRAQGLLTCGKHFPGHGDTAADSHLELPRVARDRRALARTELPPFRAACRAAVPMLMTAHVVYPALDPHLPATLSRPILTGLLRRRFGFRGVIASDDLEMRAIADHWGPGEAAVLALNAGCDLLLFCHRQDWLRDAVAAVERAVASGRLPAARVADAARRVSRLIRWRREHARRQRLAIIGCAAHRRLAAAVRVS
ncbi:MAG: beta-N-acetylhexosaminidase [Polyangiaceae bacterium UTPRO1]|jgi:beta-N-acetylhexosaminidase|nr:beta-N-acetylhexosaminidase [Myxococcales bacterium]OQY67989.1 MAG: beta-N-acetylhexosaminidase [Polyangiaceae bacterium UTPRO1]